MAYIQEIASRMWNRIARTQGRVQRLMVQKSAELGLALLSVDMMVVVRDAEKFVIANILPKAKPLAGQWVDFALLYLDLPTARLASGFYKLQLCEDAIEPRAMLVDVYDQPIGTAKYYGLDLFAAIAGPKTVPTKKLPIFETFSKSNTAYVIGGTHADGQAFAIVLDL